MIRLTYAHRWTMLVDALAEHLSDVRSLWGPLTPVTVVVPHQLAGAYLKIQLADRLGIAANLRFAHFRPYIAHCYEVTGELRLLTPPRLSHLLLTELDNIDGQELTPVARYLNADGPAERRRAQLAANLSRLYDEYAVSRPEMLRAWADGEARSGPALRDDDGEGWQAALWRRLRRAAAAVDGPPLMTIDEALDAPVQLPEALFVFDVLLGAPALQAVLAEWSKHCRLEVYATNPCLEFWEDLPAGGRVARALRARLVPRRDGAWSAPVSEDEPLALQLWGRPGRENVRRLNQLTDCDFDGRFEIDPDPTTLLARLQDDILHRRPPSSLDPENAPSAPADDQSLLVLASPGARREVETIVESIWAEVAAGRSDEDGSLRDGALAFSDIGIVLAGRDADIYRSHLAAVFEEYHQVPHHFLDVPVAPGSRVIEAVELLLGLPSSRFTRQDLLRLMTHPTVRPADDASTVDDWIAWCEDLAIVHGADHDDHAGTYIEADLLNWDQGLTRLALGLFMAAENDAGPVFFAKSSESGHRYLPHNVAFDQTQSAAQLVTLARSLIADARFMAGRRLSLAEWSELWRITVTAYIRPREDGDERDLQRVLGILERFEDEALTDHPLPLPVFVEHMRSALTDLYENQGQPLADGVTVAPLRLAANLPLKVVYLPGLAEGAFPVVDQQSSLDVRRHDRRPLEVSGRERDQYLFLSRLLATERKVVLSYVARDASSGDERAPAATLVELLRILRPYVDRDPADRLIARPPLRRYDGQPHPFASESARREIETRRLRQALVEQTSPSGGLDVAAIETRVGPAVWRQIAHHIGLHSPPGDQVASLPDTVTLRALRLFLEDPLQGWVHHTLGLRTDEDDDDRLDVVDEVFRTDALLTLQLLREVLLESVRDGRPVDAVYSALADQLEVRGRMPTGTFKRADRQRHLAILDGWSRGLRKVFANRPRPFDPIRFGRGSGIRGAAKVSSAVTVVVDSGPLELRGTTQPCLDHPPASVVLRPRPKPKGGAPTHELGAFIDQVTRSAAGETANAAYAVWSVYGDGQAVRTRFDPFGQDEAQSYLSGLITELRTEPHHYLLPFDIVYRAHARGDTTADGWTTLLAAARPARFGPVAGLAAPPPPPARAQQILDTRFGPFFRRRHEEGTP